MKLMKKSNLILLLLSAAFLLTGLCGCSAKKSEPYSKTATYFDTVIIITLYDADKLSCIDHCFEMAGHYENLFSRTVAGSDVSRINDANGEFVTVNPETIELLKDGLRYCELSEGKFDITVGALSDLWDITHNPGNIPSEIAIEAALATVDYHNIVIDGNRVALKKEGAKLDLGGIAKGYVADRMKEYLLSQNITSGMIDLGGNVLTIGDKPDGSRYRIGIQKPFDEMNAPIAGVEISDQTVVSSGVYERYFKIDDKIYHHILDTATGYPTENDLLGVTIICKDSVDGDGLSTTCFSLGLERGMELIESLDGTEAVFITDDYELHKSSGIGKTIPLTEQ